MEAVPTRDRGTGRRRRQLAATIKESVRELRGELALLNHRIGARANLRDVDLDCLDLISRYGPLSPSEAGRRAGLHPATVTGVLDRLERAGWVTREPHPSDRRAVVIRAAPGRSRELIKLYAGMNAAMDNLCDRYTEAELDLLADFLARVADAGRTATEELT